jgi:hypothetical protein
MGKPREMDSFRWTFLVAALLSASAVVSCDPQTDPYKEVYWTGCGAGIMDTGGTTASYAARDDPRYATDPHYREEWDDGFKICYNHKSLKK